MCVDAWVRLGNEQICIYIDIKCIYHWIIEKMNVIKSEIRVCIKLYLHQNVLGLSKNKVMNKFSVLLKCLYVSYNSLISDFIFDKLKLWDVCKDEHNII